MDLLTKKSELKMNSFSTDFQFMQGQKDSLNHPIRFNARAHKWHASITDGMPLFLIFERQCFRLSTRNNPSAHILRKRIILPISAVAIRLLPL